MEPKMEPTPIASTSGSQTAVKRPPDTQTPTPAKRKRKHTTSEPPKILTLSLKCLVAGCSFATTQQGQLQKHQADAHKQKRYPCLAFECGEQFEKRTAYFDHKRTAHLNRSTIWVCLYCPQRFLSDVTLFRHINDIHQTGQFQCGRCPFIAATRQAILTHQEYTFHPIACPFADCHAFITSISEWVLHRRLHQAYCCKVLVADAEVAAKSKEECGFISADRFDVMRHIRLEHGKLVEECGGDATLLEEYIEMFEMKLA